MNCNDMFQQPARPDLKNNPAVRSQLDDLLDDINSKGLCGEHLIIWLPRIFGTDDEGTRLALHATPTIWKNLIRLGAGDAHANPDTAPISLLIRMYCNNPEFWPVAATPTVTSDDINTLDDAISEYLPGGNKGHISLLSGRSTSRAYSWTKNTNTTKTPVTALLGYLLHLTQMTDQRKAKKCFKEMVANAEIEATNRGIPEILKRKDWKNKEPG